MYLSSVEIIGFKSFAQKTPLQFGEGLSAIVGPNGCGKTNIVDAIRWALGEQKTAVLRSDAMENVIFNGTRTRRPVGMAEVSLTIQNNRQILPTEYSEVTITRRLFRNGESQYFLNKTQCRLRDILELFMDTGMGADAYSVIELKMVESILSDRTDERRHLFEEAAGVTKYKARRKETKRRIDSIQQDVARVQDILREVQKSVQSLGRQADKARQHAEISTQLRSLEAHVIYADYQSCSQQITLFEQALLPLMEQKGQLEKAVEMAESARQKIESDAEKAELEMKELQLEMQAAAKSASHYAQQTAVISERIKAFAEAVQRAALQEKQASAELQQASEGLLIANEKSERLAHSYQSAEKDMLYLKDIREKARTETQRLRNEARIADSALIALDKTIAERRSASDRASERLHGLQRRIQETQAEAASTAHSVSGIQQDIARQELQRDNHVQAIHAAEHLYHQSQERSTSLQQQISTLQHGISAQQSEKGRLQASLEFLQNLVDTAESSVFLTKSATWQPAGGKVTLAEIVDAEDSLRIALEAALGESGRYFVVDSREEALAGCAELSRSGKGKASFLCRAHIPEMPAPAALLPQNGILGWASEIVNTEPEIRNALRLILHNTILVENAAAALELIKTAPHPALRAITLQGEIYGSSGLIRGGAISSTEGKRIGRREQIARQEKRLAELNTEVQNMQSELQTLQQELKNINLRLLSDAVRRAEQEKNAFEQSLSQKRYRLDALEHARQKQQDSLQKFNAELQELQGSSLSLNDHMDELMAERGIADEKKQKVLADIRSADAALNNAEQKYRAAELDMVQKRADEKAALSECKRLEEIIKQKDAQIHSLQEEQKRAVQEQQHLQQALQENTGLQSAEQDREKNLREILIAREEKMNAYRQQRQQARSEESNARHALQDIMQQIHMQNLHLQENKILMKSILERATAHTPDIDMANAPAEWQPESEFNIEESREKVRKLSSKLQSLGNVNFLALEEFEKENERLQFLKTQLADLSQAEQALQITMEEINQTAQKRFMDTFTQIRAHFQNLFSMLFSGRGEAEIHLGEGDPLEASIEITAKPPGKRPQSIELLSAGEKTLTAIALLFSIYLVKPSPFCILDEVDAPLDDANIDRYLQLIRSFSANTQFLMITHNKKTMEAADTLYGVTQEEEGVSKVVSVRLTGQRRISPAA